LKRRKFSLVSGSAVFSGLALDSVIRPVVGVNFETSIQNPNTDPSNLDSILVHLDTLEVIPKYLDISEPMSIRIKLDIENNLKAEKKARDIDFKNGEKIVLNQIVSNSTDISTILIDGIESEEAVLDGKITIIVNHKDISSKEYKKRFRISKGETKIDSFEDQNMNEYSGNTGATSIISNAGIESKYGLSMTNGGGRDRIYRTDITVSKGDRLRVLTRNEGGNIYSAGYALYGYQNDGSCYMFGWGSEEGILKYVDSDGNSNSIYRTGEILNTGKDYEFIADWGSDGIHTLIVKELDGSEVDRGSGSNAIITSGGVGFEIGSSGASKDHYFDGYKTL
jgi:hypothetical protein